MADPDLDQQDKPRRQVLLLGVVVAVVAAAVILVASMVGDDGTSPTTAPGASGVTTTAPAPVPSVPSIPGLRTFAVTSQNHVNGPVAYPQTPPVGGDHDQTWQNCGFYNESIVTERGVHSLEHGAVWITYRPSLATDEVDLLRRLATSQSHILVSPWDGELGSPVMASAWGRQLAVPSASDPALAEFVRAFRSGPQTPEPGAPCTGGRSTAR